MEEISINEEIRKELKKLKIKTDNIKKLMRDGNDLVIIRNGMFDIRVMEFF